MDSGDGYVEPYTLAMTIARAARKLGVTFETDRPVTAIQLDRGIVRGVDTPAGPLQSPRVIVAAGPWVERVAGAVGLAVDTVPLRHQHWTTAPMADVPANLPVVRVPDASVYIRPEVGGLMLGGFEAHPKAFSMTELAAHVRDRAHREGPRRAGGARGSHAAHSRPWTAPRF